MRTLSTSAKSCTALSRSLACACIVCKSLGVGPCAGPPLRRQPGGGGCRGARRCWGNERGWEVLPPAQAASAAHLDAGHALLELGIRLRQQGGVLGLRRGRAGLEGKPRALLPLLHTPGRPLRTLGAALEGPGRSSIVAADQRPGRVCPRPAGWVWSHFNLRQLPRARREPVRSKNGSPAFWHLAPWPPTSPCVQCMHTDRVPTSCTCACCWSWGRRGASESSTPGAPWHRKHRGGSIEGQRCRDCSS